MGVAAIWYLTKDWKEEFGGQLVDLQATEGSAEAKAMVPIYNTLVAFEVPHWHEVRAVSANRYRYSIFGWWHQQGKRYELPGEIPCAIKSVKRGKKRKVGSAAVAAVTKGDDGDAGVADEVDEADATTPSEAEGPKLRKLSKKMNKC